MTESNLHVFDINLILALSGDEESVSLVQVSDLFSSSPRYVDIIYVLQYLNPPSGMSKSNMRSLKLKASKYCILDSALYWKDPGGVLLNCLVEDESK